MAGFRITAEVTYTIEGRGLTQEQDGDRVIVRDADGNEMMTYDRVLKVEAI